MAGCLIGGWRSIGGGAEDLEDAGSVGDGGSGGTVVAGQPAGVGGAELFEGGRQRRVPPSTFDLRQLGVGHFDNEGVGAGVLGPARPSLHQQSSQSEATYGSDHARVVETG